MSYEYSEYNMLRSLDSGHESDISSWSIEQEELKSNSEYDFIPPQNSIIGFSTISPEEGIEEEIEDKKRYFVTQKKKNKVLFEIINESSTSNDTSKFINIKRGRKTNKSSNKQKEIHSKFYEDNILTKIQVHYITFIISFLNEILKDFNYDLQLCDLPYKFKRNITKINQQNLKIKNLREIICNEISDKYKKHKKDVNNVIYDKIKGNEQLNKIFNIKYKLFYKVYFKGNKKINLEEFGINKEIELSENIKMFTDLIKESKNSKINKDYNEKIEFIAKQYLN